MYSNETDLAAEFIYNNLRFKIRFSIVEYFPSIKNNKKFVKVIYFQRDSNFVNKYHIFFFGLSFGSPNQDCDVIDSLDIKYLLKLIKRVTRKKW
jgi:hypothetical protein